MLLSSSTSPINCPQSLNVKFLGLLAFLFITSSTVRGAGEFWGFENDRLPYYGQIWKASINGEAENPYKEGIEKILETFESTTGRLLVPDVHRRAGIKVYSNSGAGLQTPLEMTKAVIEELEKRGFSKEELFILDARETNLRSAGYLPPLSRMPLVGPYFEDVRIYSLDNLALKSEKWFYDSPLPQEFTSPLGRELLKNTVQLNPEEARKSFLPNLLVESVDFWINMPVVCNHPGVLFSGALVNGTLWNVTNGNRFFNSPANAPVAVAEIASIPELLDTWALSIISLENYQYIGGPAFNALYTNTLPEIWASVDPVILDANLILLLNKDRVNAGFRAIPEVPDLIDYAVQLNLGYGLTQQTKWINLENENELINSSTGF